VGRSLEVGLAENPARCFAATIERSAATRLRVQLADDHPLVAAGVASVLSRDQFEVVGIAHDGSDVLPLVASTAPDVVVLDLSMPGLDGLACLSRIHAQHPDLPVVILTASSAPLARDAALAAGAADFVAKSIDLGALAPALLRAVSRSRGRRRPSAPRRAATSAFTSREIVVLASVAKGLSNQEIADSLNVSLATVKFHLGNIYRKLGVSNRTAAAQWALRGSHRGGRAA
jgi:DNA-binding NarL/FixJ family response regulator